MLLSRMNQSEWIQHVISLKKCWMKARFQSDLEPRGKSSSRDNWGIKRDSCRSRDEEMKPIISQCGDKRQWITGNGPSESGELPSGGPRWWFLALMDGPAVRGAGSQSDRCHWRGWTAFTHTHRRLWISSSEPRHDSVQTQTCKYMPECQCIICTNTISNQVSWSQFT